MMAVPEQQTAAAPAQLSSATNRKVRDAWILAHPTFPQTRPGLLTAILLGFGQSAQSWQIHQACDEAEHEKNKKIVIAEASSAALVSALFLTVTTTVIFEVEGMPQNGISEVGGLTNLFYSLFVMATMCFAMSIVYSLSLIIIMESCSGEDATEVTHALGIGVHWPISNFIIGIFLLLIALFVKGYFDVDRWVWILGIVLIGMQLVIYFCFLGTAVQAQWDILDAKISQRSPLPSSSPPNGTSQMHVGNHASMNISPVPIGSVMPIISQTSLASMQPVMVQGMSLGIIPPALYPPWQGETESPPSPFGHLFSNHTLRREHVGELAGSVSGQHIFEVTHGDDLNLVQDWVRQLPEMEHDLQEHVCACFRDELVDVEVLVELQAADFAYMGVTKLGWQKKLLRRSRQELACRLLAGN